MYDENILINIDDNDNNHDNNEIHKNETVFNNNELETILKEINDNSFDDYNFNEQSQILLMTKTLDYDMNYNIKQLLMICDYYGLLKEVKLNKLKKQEIISFLLDFEENIENSLLVYKRKQLWYFMNELKNDKFMKKYILCQM
jgi:hypothetical protein